MSDRQTLPVLEVPLPGRPDVRAEWLVTNGMGGFASGTVAGDTTRRYHGLLVSAFPNPVGRMVMLTALSDNFVEDDIVSFRLEGGTPVWRFRAGGVEIEKRIAMAHRQNTTVVRYRLVQGDAFDLKLIPVVDFRQYEESVSEAARDDYAWQRDGAGYSLAAEGVPAPLRMRLDGEHRFREDRALRERVLYAMEEARGYRAHGILWSPGSFSVPLRGPAPVAFVASTEPAAIADSLSAEEVLTADATRKAHLVPALSPAARDPVGIQLALAADQFVITPVGRQRDVARAAAAGEELLTVIAGYHWFTDWGRDTMISLEGLTLTTGRQREAAEILRTFALYVRDGLIPNMFPDGSDQGLYHTADATLWFFHALHRYSAVTGSDSLIAELLPALRQIADAHIAGTRFGIGVDGDGLLRQGEEGYQLTWMDAKVDGWVVTPRRGKAVEINALWHNALCLLAAWERAQGDAAKAARYGEYAARARTSFNARFWNEQTGHLFDVVDGPDGDDASCRPNQVFAISLPHPVLDESRWPAVLDVVERKLLTPVGLRSLSPDHPDYKRNYHGDLRTRDAAYHQGTVWGWLIGPWVDAWLKVHPGDKARARRFLDGLVAHLPEFGAGSIAEVFDAEPPYTPRGCIAQAWSVAEVLRCWARTAR